LIRLLLGKTAKG